MGVSFSARSKVRAEDGKEGHDAEVVNERGEVPGGSRIGGLDEGLCDPGCVVGGAEAGVHGEGLDGAPAGKGLGRPGRQPAARSAQAKPMRNE